MPPSAHKKTPVIGITADNRDNTAASNRYELSMNYPRAVATAGGTPVALLHETDAIDHYLKLCDGFIFTGGVDPRTECFDENTPTHPAATLMDPTRQAFETALLEKITRRDIPTLGVCLGMQLMALIAGGTLDQHLADTTPTHEDHLADRAHAVTIELGSPGLPAKNTAGSVVSHHHQAVADPGPLAVAARAHDGLIEAICDPAKPFYLGVQWHPERGGDGPLAADLIAAFIRAASAA